MNIKKFLISIIIPQLAGFIGSVFTTGSLDTWYTALNKPSFNPPSWLFGPVWITLYLLMGIALYFVWTSNSKYKRTAIWIFAIQIILNAIWSIIFFGLKNPMLAFFELCILLILIVLNIRTFWKVDKKAGILLLPYLLWSSFALVLNYSIWQLNL